MTSERHDFRAAQARMLDRYGVEAESRFVEAPSVEGRAHVLVSGEGPAVVLLNGIGTPGAMWAPLMATLEGHRLHAVDLPGYGLSDGGRRFSDDLRPNAVRFLGEVLGALGLARPAFVANSLGALWTCWLALDDSSRVGPLVFVGCPALAPGTSAPLPMRLLSIRPLGRLLTRIDPPSAGQVERLTKVVREWPVVPELADLLLATERLPDFRPTFLAMLHTLLRLRGARPEMSLAEDHISAIEQSTLLVWGHDDPFGDPAVGERMAAAMPAAELRVVPGGHVPWLRQAETIGPAATRFLRRNAREIAGRV